MAAKASGLDNNNNNNSPYRQLANNISKAFKKMEENTIHPSEVAKVILQAVMADNPDFRYVVGKDAAMMLEAKRNMSDREFQDLRNSLICRILVSF